MEFGPLPEVDVRRAGLLALQAALGDAEILCFPRREHRASLGSRGQTYQLAQHLLIQVR